MEQESAGELLEAPEHEGGDAQSLRIAGLERSVRRLWIAVAALLLAGGALATGAGTTREELSVRELTITDAEGQGRIVLSASAEGGTLSHFDAQGRLRISQGIEPDGKASIALLDPNGAKRIGAAAFADGDAGIAILDRSEKVRIQLITEADGLAGSVQLDPQGRKRIETFAAADGRALQSFLDPFGGVRLQLGTRPDGSAVSSQPHHAEAAAGAKGAEAAAGAAGAADANGG